MVIALKEVCILGEWHFLGPVYIKNDTLIWPAMSQCGKVHEKGQGSFVSKIHLKFHSPVKARQFNSESILQLRDKYPDFDKVFGCWPFDHAPVIRYPHDMDDMYRTYGISDYRLIAWNE